MKQIIYRILTFPKTIIKLSFFSIEVSESVVIIPKSTKCGVSSKTFITPKPIFLNPGSIPKIIKFYNK